MMQTDSHEILDYDNWYVCANCGCERVPLEGQKVTLDDRLMCFICKEDECLDDLEE